MKEVVGGCGRLWEVAGGCGRSRVRMMRTISSRRWPRRKSCCPRSTIRLLLPQVNHSPSFTCDSPLDQALKSSVLKGTMEIVSYCREELRLLRRCGSRMDPALRVRLGELRDAYACYSKWPHFSAGSHRLASAPSHLPRAPAHSPCPPLSSCSPPFRSDPAPQTCQP